MIKSVLTKTEIRETHSLDREDIVAALCAYAGVPRPAAVKGMIISVDLSEDGESAVITVTKSEQKTS